MSASFPMPVIAARPASGSATLAALEAALPRIPPLWPLRHFVAVNPFIGLVDRPFAEACTLLQRTTGRLPLQSAADYLAAHRRGEITASDLAETEALEAELQTPADHATSPIQTVADLLDAERPRAHWSVFVVEEISKWCAITFDHNQTTWRSPWQDIGLYAAWREAALHDHNPEAFGLTGFRRFVRGLPDDALAGIETCIDLLGPSDVELADMFHRQLTTIAGWAGYAQYVVREDALRGRSNPVLRDLLAIRLAYDAALFNAFTRDGMLRANWRHQATPKVLTPQLEARCRWQNAYEAGYQRRLARDLTAQPASAPATRPPVQAVFCIDVRSEVIRRHIETAWPGAQTLGFAGFFGFPVAHLDSATGATGSRCPVLLVPPVATADDLSPATIRQVRRARAEAGAWKAFQNSAASCFSFVESVGLAFGAALSRSGESPTPSCTRVAPTFTSALSVAARADLATGALRNMSLTRNFARLVLICGHGSTSANNPYASGLDCGACGGHAGDVNARLAAATLNDPAVRQELGGRGIAIPADTVFLAGLHHTVSDDVTLFDSARIPASHTSDVETLRRALATAGTAARRERAPSLGLGALAGSALDTAVHARASDIAQTRPEWGLANNAALIVAPRSRTAGLNLHGRAFLHDYEAAADPELKVLTLILTAPVVVASWINLQYYASRVDPETYGAGNKVLHNIAGGLGALEGNGGDLKVGLPLQSIHDGEKWIHEPRRLTVYIEAATENLDTVLTAQPTVRQLFDHGWIHLIALEGPSAQRYTLDGWRAID